MTDHPSAIERAREAEELVAQLAVALASAFGVTVDEVIAEARAAIAERKGTQTVGEHRCQPCTDRHGAPGWTDQHSKG